MVLEMLPSARPLGVGLSPVGLDVMAVVASQHPFCER